MLYIILSVLMILGIGIFFYMQRPAFGRKPDAKKKSVFAAMNNYQAGAFQNPEPTPPLAEGVTYVQVLKDFLFTKNPHKTPPRALPSQKTDLHQLLPDEQVLVWFGHSSYFIQAGGKKFLVDPVFSGNASPLPGTMKSFPGSDIYTVTDIPDIDVLILTHDHWDHLDYPTVLALRTRVKQIYTGLGVGEHLRSWGFPENMITEMNWHDVADLGAGFQLTATPARHFSGRSFTRNTSLWLSFVLTTPALTIFIGGDSGYGSHFKKIGDQYGPFDLAILECGQYNPHWRYIHMLPEQLVPAAKDLNTLQLMIVHWAKFPLSNHNWNEPPLKVTAFAKDAGLPLATPMIGEKLDLTTPPKDWPAWWDLQEA